MPFDEQPAPAPPRLPRNAVEKDNARRVIVILDKAPLEIARLGGGGASKDQRSRSADTARYALLAGDDHQNLLKKLNKDPAFYRPDITHQCLLTLLDSPLNKAGRLQVYIRTTKNVLVEVNPMTRIPRTYGRFSGLMVQLLHRLSVKSEASSEKLLNVIKNPVEDHLPIRHVKVGLSGDAPLVKVREWAQSLPADRSVVFWIGGMAHGEDDFEGVAKDACIAISEYPLSASVACGKICDAFEDLFGII